MSSVSKEDQYNQIHGIKEKLGTPFVGRYKPKYELVDRKSTSFLYRKENKSKSIHRKSNSVSETFYSSKRRVKSSMGQRNYSTNSPSKRQSLSQTKNTGAGTPFKSQDSTKRETKGNSEIFQVETKAIIERKSKHKRMRSKNKKSNYSESYGGSGGFFNDKKSKSNQRIIENIKFRTKGKFWNQYLKENLKRPRMDKF
mmetsp:Transcript_31802/g.28160  ORF Transcript_31802/g.28160 Transcript_31802/m.28160 type:complete len:198 (-) Transcript_31802:47-640(-)